jgi:hypothetical protein
MGAPFDEFVVRAPLDAKKDSSAAILMQCDIKRP